MNEELMYFVIPYPGDLHREGQFAQCRKSQLPLPPKTVSTRSKCLVIIYLLGTIYSEENCQDVFVILGSVRALDVPAVLL